MLKIYRRKWLRWPEEKRRYFNHYLTMREGTFKTWILCYPNQLYCFIAEIDGEPAGMALILDDNLCQSGIYIRPKFRRKGIGHKLLTKVHSKFSKVLVMHWNKPSYKLFSKFNTKRVNREYNWLTLGEKR